MHQPDYRVIESAARNERPQWLPFYEHSISPHTVQGIVGGDWVGLQNSSDPKDVDEFFHRFLDFLVKAGYDTVSYEIGLTSILEGGALGEHKDPVITDEASFDAYPWEQRAAQFWEVATSRFDGLARNLPEGMKAVGGVGNGVFEIVQDLVGYENLAYMQVDAPDLFAKLFARIGDLMVEVWQEFIQRYGGSYCVCRFGDDLGFKTGPLLQPATIQAHIIPQYRQIIDLVHGAGRPFLLHSCGHIFEIMDALIDAGIDAKHSNEDVICPFDAWITRYNDRIGLFGGIDMDIIDRESPEQVYRITKELARELRAKTKGFAFGTGNQIGSSTPPENYAEMLRALREVRAEGN